MATDPVYVPDFELQIAGQSIPVALRGAVTSISYVDGHQAADRVEIALANADLRWLQKHIKGLGVTQFPGPPALPPDNILPSTPEGLFDIDTGVTLSMGYAPGPLEPMFVGEITGVEANFPTGGMPTMTIVAHDFLHRLSPGKYARGFGPLPDFIVASILGIEHQLLAAIEPTIIAASTAVMAVNLIFKGAGTKQKGQSHLQLLEEIAALYDADFYVEGDVLWITRFMKEYSPRLSLVWGHSLLSFQPKVTTVGQAVGVAMKFTLREIPLDFLVSVWWDFDRESIGISVLPGVAAPAGSGPVFTIVDRPVGSPADIMNSALLIAHELRTKLNRRLTGTGSAVGDPRIRAGAVVRLENLGPDFSGDYRVVSATHSMGASGYVTQFEVMKEIIP
jgi:uncharacterized protein